MCLYKLVDCKCEIPIKFITIIDLRWDRSIDRSSLLEVFPEIGKKCKYVTVQAQQTTVWFRNCAALYLTHIPHISSPYSAQRQSIYWHACRHRRYNISTWCYVIHWHFFTRYIHLHRWKLNVVTSTGWTVIVTRQSIYNRIIVLKLRSQQAYC